MNKSILLIALLSFSFFTLNSCDKDTEPVNEEELITTVYLSFTNLNESIIYTFVANDSDGNGGNSPIVDDINLQDSTYYKLEVKFIDSSNSNNPNNDLTPKIVEEGTDHLVCFNAEGAMVEPVANDDDGNGHPLGIISYFTTGGTGSGNLKLTLKHLPNKSDSTPCNSGSTDVEVTFPVEIQ
ncbi:MAG: type 1 periplasmic binding fold superfamily protein [Saprospiraceae bacterium]|nr:type 1 periplasmic binding fold superfamily protein [Saprospiraceae bacterium]